MTGNKIPAVFTILGYQSELDWARYDEEQRDILGFEWAGRGDPWLLFHGVLEDKSGWVDVEFSTSNRLEQCFVHPWPMGKIEGIIILC